MEDNAKLFSKIVEEALTTITKLVESTTKLTGEMNQNRVAINNLEKSLDKLYDKLEANHSSLVARVEVLEKNLVEKSTTEKLHLTWLKRLGVTITFVGAFFGWVFNIFHGKLILQWLQDHLPQ